MTRVRTPLDRLALLVTTYPDAFLVPGGGELELVGLAEHLRSLELDVDVYGPASRPLSRYDCVLHFSIHPDGLPVVRRIKRSGTPVILWPNVWWSAEPTPEERDTAREFFALADRIAFKSQAELDNVLGYVALDKNKIILVPWGVDAHFVATGVGPFFKTVYRLADYILWVGVIEERKNQLTAVRALAGSEIPVVFIGEPRNPEYLEACVSAAPAHFRFLPAMPPASTVLVSAVQNCTLYLEVPLEPAGLSALEAGTAGRRLVLSDDPWSREMFRTESALVDPRSEQAIRDGVAAMLKAGTTGALARQLRAANVLPGCLAPLVRELKTLANPQAA